MFVLISYNTESKNIIVFHDNVAFVIVDDWYLQMLADQQKNNHITFIMQSVMYN